MTYADFAYYQDSYNGNQIRDATAFLFLSARASEYMDMVTFRRLLDGLPEEYEAEIKNCCCALADAIFQYQICADASGDGSGESAPKKSETNGKYSVTYQTAGETISSLLNGGAAGLQDYMKSICMRYLGHTGLMYRGV